METNNRQILERITQYIIENPNVRFCQALANLGINQFTNPTNPMSDNFKMKDNYNDENIDVLKRMTK